ncbi:hypothetical protein CDAR_113861 [Caerostris darwini]|uniref:Uncharacterized protein n=1 Tax=Caerostris darwini TaxID=1538125 RepID=A0AAV4U5A5_9ARAC|nr:hypothetical protein CDAR_113861 [Caerostris darwini]
MTGFCAHSMYSRVHSTVGSFIISSPHVNPALWPQFLTNIRTGRDKGSVKSRRRGLSKSCPSDTLSHAVGFKGGECAIKLFDFGVVYYCIPGFGW